MKPASRLLPLIFIGALAFMVANTVLTLTNLNTILNSDRDVDRTSEIIFEMEGIMASVTDAETGVRGYLLTGEKTMLDTYNKAWPTYETHIKQLKQLAANRLPKKDILTLERLVTEKRHYLQDHITTYDYDKSVSTKNLLEGNDLMNRIRNRVVTLENNLTNQLNRKEDTTQTQVITMYVGVISSTVLNLFLVFIGYYLINRDLAKRVKSEEKKNEFISVASHELKTPLTSIKAFTQLLERYYRDKSDEKAQGYLRRMDGQLNRLSTLVEDLLDVTKIQAGKMVFNEDVFDIDELIDEVIGDIQPVAESHKITRKGSANKRVYADRYRLGQVLTNLLTNAIKYSPGKDRVVVHSSANEDAVIIAVQDFGIGVPKDKQKHLFDRFYRIDEDNRHSFPGLGLGLYISAQIMKRHKGRIWIDSKEGEGSTFHVSLPITLHSRLLGGLRKSGNKS